LFGEAEKKIPLRKLRLRWEDTITTDLKELGWYRVV
jgi:hypothetical protein